MKKEQWGIWIAFLGGVFLANLLGKELLSTYGVLNQYYLSQYSVHNVDGERLLCFIILERSKAVLFLFLLGRALSGRVYALLAEGTVAAVFGFLMVVSIANLGVRGIVVCIAMLFPQWIFYLAALFLYATTRKRQNAVGFGRGRYGGGVTERLSDALLPGVLVVLGIITESCINPVLLGYILKII